MSDTKQSHTPGPWFIHEKQQTFDQISVGPNPFFSAAKALGFDRPETQANAYLIAAAPEMLGALVAARDANEKLHHLVTNAEERMISINALALIEKAIAKARGEK